MNIRRFPGAVIAAATLTLCVHSAAFVAARAASTSNITPGALAATAEPVQLSRDEEDILRLSRAKVNDDVAVAFIQNGDRRFDLTAPEIVYLRKEGVSDRVLTAMLNQPQPATASPSPPPSVAPTTTPSESAPQHITPPASTLVVETAPASSLYVVPSTPTYYSFYDPWPYSWSWSYWYTYPLYTFGYWWGNGNFGCWNDWNCNNGRWNKYCNTVNSPANGNPPPADGNPPPRGVGSVASNQGGVQTTKVRNAPQSPARGGLSPNDRRTIRTPPTRVPAGDLRDDVDQSRASRTRPGQPNVRPARSSETAALRNIRIDGNDRVAVARPNESRTSREGSPASVRIRGAGQAKTSRPIVNQNVTLGARSGGVRPHPNPTWNRPSSPAANRYAARPAANYQRTSFRPSYGRPSGSATSLSRSSPVSSFRSSGGTSGFRSGRSVASAPRMSSGGGFRGGSNGGIRR